MFGVLWLVCGFVVFALDSAYWLGSSGLSWGLFSFGLVFGGVFVWFVFVWFVLVSFGLVFGGMERGWGSISNKTIPPPSQRFFCEWKIPNVGACGSRSEIEMQPSDAHYLHPKPLIQLFLFGW
jgi:hypothetical protein